MSVHFTQEKNLHRDKLNLRDYNDQYTRDVTVPSAWIFDGDKTCRDATPDQERDWYDDPRVDFVAEIAENGNNK